MKFSKLTKPEIEGILTKANFTDEEEQIFIMLCRGSTQKEVSYKLSISVSTVERTVREIKRKWKEVSAWNFPTKNC